MSIRAIVVAAIGIVATPAAALSPDALTLTANNNQFAIDLYRQVAAQGSNDRNLLISPLSISAALSMTYAGARGTTAAEMASALRLSLPAERLHPAFGEVLRDLNTVRDGYELRIANRLFGQEGLAFKQPFLDITAQDYGAPLEAVNFVGDPQGSRQRINDWVEEQTNEKIKDLLPPDSVTSDTRLVLTNAIYLNGKWKYKFDEQSTRPESFFGLDGTASQAATMFNFAAYHYGDFNGYKMLEMPYAGDALSMVVMLPDAYDGLPALEASLTSELITSNLESLGDTEVFVSLPKFKFDASFELESTLAAMGMARAFADANFTGMLDRTALQLSNVLHKAFIDVNESGTEAAAATAVIVGITNCVCGPPPEFRADHPFLFALRDVHSGSLLFLGRVTQPGEAVISLLSPPSVPEPSAILLLAIGVAVGFGRAFRRGWT